MVARLASIASGTKRLQVRVLRWSFFFYRLSYPYSDHVILSRLSRQGLQPKHTFYLPQHLNRLVITHISQTRHGLHATFPAFI
jgi:hypothetical protein